MPRQKIRSQQAELEKGLSKLHATCAPVEHRPKKKLRQIRGHQHVSNSKQQLNPRALQVKSVWKAKIEHIISRGNGFEKVDKDHNHVHEHMLTYPFRTVDNSLYHSCVGLTEFSHYTGTEGLNDAVYGRNDIASSIIIDGNSVSSVTPGREMDDNIIIFLSVLVSIAYRTISCYVESSTAASLNHIMIKQCLLPGCVPVQAIFLHSNQLSLIIS